MKLHLEKKFSQAATKTLCSLILNCYLYHVHCAEVEYKLLTRVIDITFNKTMAVQSQHWNLPQVWHSKFCTGTGLALQFYQPRSRNRILVIKWLHHRDILLSLVYVHSDIRYKIYKIVKDVLFLINLERTCFLFLQLILFRNEKKD